MSHSGLVTEAEEKKETVMECFPDSAMAEEYRKLAEAIYELSKDQKDQPVKKPMKSILPIKDLGRD